MPVVINLKNLTPSDGPGIIVDKVNFNFNQLLALGVGQPGPAGSQGPQGPAGPIGLEGDTGPRGTRWYTYLDIDPNDPELQPTDIGFTPPSDLQLGDLYTDGLFNVWEYKLNPSVPAWVVMINSNTLFNNFLVSTGAQFKRNFSPSSGNTLEERFITFIQTNGSDRSTTNGAGYFNDSLFLHNFDHTQLGTEFTGSNVRDNFYVAMQSIYVDQSVYNDDINSRHHFNLGAVYMDGVLKITHSNENLKIKYKIESGTRLSVFNASKNDADAASLGYFNSAFKFNISKWNGSTTHTTLSYFLASASNIQQFTDGSFHAIDGFAVVRSTSKVAFGLDAGTSRLALIGSTGSGAVTSVYSNLPIEQFGTVAGETQFASDVLHLVGGAKTINADAALAINAGTTATIKGTSVILQIGTANGDATVRLGSSGKVSIGVKNIPTITNKVANTDSAAPTANLMVNGSIAMGLRKIISGSLTSEMVLGDSDVTIYVDSIPIGSTSFDLTTAGAANSNRLVFISNNTVTPFDIKASATTLGTLAAKTTAIYQSFGLISGGAWILLFSAPNQFTSSDGNETGDIKAIVADPSYITANFTGTGLGTNLRLGWAMCNSQNGTIDLRKRFIVGYDPADTDYNLVGKIGGEKLHVLLTTEMPPHSHSITGETMQKEGTTTQTVVALDTGTDPNIGSVTYAAGTKIGNTGGGAGHENRPPFYTLLFIQKL